MPSEPQGEAADHGEARFGFSRALRLKRGWEFDLVFRTGRRAHGELVRLGAEAPTFNYDTGLLAMEIGTLLARAAPASERANG